jgi:ribosome-binding protein aMBF1 (putative translation factor)
VWRALLKSGKLKGNLRAPSERRIPGEAVTESESFVRVRMQLRDTLAHRVRELRLSLKMSQRDLAEDAEMRQALISEIERGEANPTLDSVLRIAIALDVSFIELFKPRRL